MLVSPRCLLADAEADGYAVGAFNIYNLDTLFAVLDAATEERSPVIVQVYALDFVNLRRSAVASAAIELIKAAPIPAALHLDHATDYAHIVQALGAGFSSVMVDASALPLDENIVATAKAVEFARALNAFTEAELGRIYRIGSAELERVQGDVADPDDAQRLVDETGVESLAPAVGTAHGIYTSEPNVRFDLIQQIRERVEVPLVLHGGSGIPDHQIQRAIQCGVSKINVGTDLKYTWSTTMKSNLSTGEKEIRTLSASAQAAVREVVKRKIRLFGSSEKA